MDTKNSERKSSASFFPSSSSSSFIYRVRRRERQQRRHTPKTLKLPTPPLKKGSSILTPNNKNSRVFFLSFVSSQKEFHANEAQKNTQRAPLVDGLSIVLFDRRRDFDERRLCDDDVNDDTFEQKKKKKKNDFDDAVVPPARDHRA